MQRRRFLSAGPIAAAALTVGATGTSQAKPGSSKPKSSAVPAEVIDPSKLGIKLEEPPDDRVVLTPFQLMDGGVGTHIKPTFMTVTPGGGSVSFAPNGADYLRVLYPTPPMTMQGKHLEVSFRGHVPSIITVKLESRAAQGGSSVVKMQQTKRLQPTDNRVRFEVPTAMLKAGTILLLEFSTSTEAFVLHNCTIERKTNPGPTAGPTKVRARRRAREIR